MLLKSVQRELGLVIDKDFEGLSQSSQIYKTVRRVLLTFAMNFLHVARISLAKVALNIITCL